MEIKAGLVPLNQSELKISGGHMADLRAKHDVYPNAGPSIDSFHEVGDFLRGIWDGFTDG